MKSELDLVTVDFVYVEYAYEIACVLRGAGLHPVYDDGPRYVVQHGDLTRTAIMVPAEEVDEAKAVLAKHYAASEARVAQAVKGWYRPLIVPAVMAVVSAVFTGYLTSEIGVSVGVAVVVFLATTIVGIAKGRTST